MSETSIVEMDKEKRRIRSFVRREGRATPGQKQAMLDIWPKRGVSPEGVLDFALLFGRVAPVVLEIGFGDGEALVDAAIREPQHDFIGAEVYSPGVGHCLLRLEQEQLGNVRLCQEDAITLLKHNIPNHSLSEIRLFFPDPWHKKKHHKRRIVDASFTRLISQKLLPGGHIHFATDWQPYADWAMEAFQRCETLENISGEGMFTPKPATRLTTKFERRGQRLGHGCWDLIFKTIV